MGVYFSNKKHETRQRINFAFTKVPAGHSDLIFIIHTR